MSMERGAWSREPEGSFSVCAPCFSTRYQRPVTLRCAAAFTLIELLVVIGIIAILSALVTPAVQGLMGTSGRRGAINTASAVFEQARLAAIENGTTAYIGFPINAIDATNGFSHLIIFRDARPGDANTNRVAVTRWQKFPSGVFIKEGANFSSAIAMQSFPSRTLPRLGTEDLTQVPALAFNRFGQLQGVNQEVSVLLGEKVDPKGEWRGGPNNYFQMTIQPLTGRTVVRDMSTNR